MFLSAFVRGLAVFGCFASMVSLCAQEPISPPLSGSVGDPLYSESTQNGPSSSLVPGDTSLTGPYIRSGVSDPLSFQIESGQMSPFAFTSLDAGSRSDAPQPILNDPIHALQYGEYRNNRLLMAGAAVRSTPSGRAATAGASLQSGFGGRAQAANSSVFLQPFSAGSSLSTGGSVLGFTDPGQVGGLDATTLAALPAPGAGDASGAGTSGAGLPSPGSSGPMMSNPTSPSPIDAAMQSGARLNNQVQVFGTGADAMPIGPLPGQTFPDASFSIVSPLGFADSTMGTAGQRSMEDATGRQSSLGGSRFSGDASPFENFETSTFLHPSLHGSAHSFTGLRAQAPSSANTSAEEVLRKERKRAIVEGRQFTPPTSFALHSMERNYVAERRKGQRRPSLLAPSVTSTTTY